LRARVTGYVFTVIVLSREAFDAIEFDAACSGEHRAAAQEMTRLADTGTQTASMPRSEAYVRAGEQWLLADDPAAAVHGFHRALADGGPSSVDPRIPLARALFQLGRTEEAEDHIRKLGSQPPRDARMCDLLAELLVEQSNLPSALAWATAGVELCLGQTPGPVGSTGHVSADSGAASPAPGAAGGTWPVSRADENELRLLLSLRFRIRNDLGLPEDDYDRLLDEQRLR
jgi:tetratricopeptide repeat protein